MELKKWYLHIQIQHCTDISKFFHRKVIISAFHVKSSSTLHSFSLIFFISVYTLIQHFYNIALSDAFAQICSDNFFVRAFYFHTYTCKFLCITEAVYQYWKLIYCQIFQIDQFFTIPAAAENIICSIWICYPSISPKCIYVLVCTFLNQLRKDFQS